VPRLCATRRHVAGSVAGVTVKSAPARPKSPNRHSMLQTTEGNRVYNRAAMNNGVVAEEGTLPGRRPARNYQFA